MGRYEKATARCPCSRLAVLHGAPWRHCYTVSTVILLALLSVLVLPCDRQSISEIRWRVFLCYVQCLTRAEISSCTPPCLVLKVRGGVLVCIYL